jgi:hypothetical protein
MFCASLQFQFTCWLLSKSLNGLSEQLIKSEEAFCGKGEKREMVAAAWWLGRKLCDHLSWVGWALST